MKKDLVGVGSVMLVWFVVLVILEYLGLEILRVALWSVPAFSLILLILGAIPKKGEIRC